MTRWKEASEEEREKIRKQARGTMTRYMIVPVELWEDAMGAVSSSEWYSDGLIADRMKAYQASKANGSPIDDRVMEAAARAIWNDDPTILIDWEKANPNLRESFLRTARSALTAAIEEMAKD
jgi:hypothetical protein